MKDDADSIQGKSEISGATHPPHPALPSLSSTDVAPLPLTSPSNSIGYFDEPETIVPISLGLSPIPASATETWSGTSQGATFSSQRLSSFRRYEPCLDARLARLSCPSRQSPERDSTGGTWTPTAPLPHLGLPSVSDSNRLPPEMSDMLTSRLELGEEIMMTRVPPASCGILRRAFASEVESGPNGGPSFPPRPWPLRQFKSYPGVGSPTLSSSHYSSRQNQAHKTHIRSTALPHLKPPSLSGSDPLALLASPSAIQTPSFELQKDVYTATVSVPLRLSPEPAPGSEVRGGPSRGASPSPPRWSPFPRYTPYPPVHPPTKVPGRDQSRIEARSSSLSRSSSLGSLLYPSAPTPEPWKDDGPDKMHPSVIPRPPIEFTSNHPAALLSPPESLPPHTIRPPTPYLHSITSPAAPPHASSPPLASPAVLPPTIVKISRRTTEKVGKAEKKAIAEYCKSRRSKTALDLEKGRKCPTRIQQAREAKKGTKRYK